MLSVSNASSKPEEFNIKDIEVVVDNEEQNWFKEAHEGKFLGIEDIWTSLNDLEKCEMLTRQELIPSRLGTPGCSGPKDQQNKTDTFLWGHVCHRKIKKRQGQVTQRPHPERHRTTWSCCKN